jgi:acetyl esterase/lipase
VIVLGHSAGAHAALWVASRGRIPAGGVVRGADPLKIKAAIAIDGPGDLEPLIGRDAEICGQPVIAPFMGGLPTQASDHYSQGDPIKLLPSGVASVMVASSVLTADEAETYRKAATAKGDQIEILSLNGAAHFDMLAPAKSQGRLVEALILQSLDIPGP